MIYDRSFNKLVILNMQIVNILIRLKDIISSKVNWGCWIFLSCACNRSGVSVLMGEVDKNEAVVHALSHFFRELQFSWNNACISYDLTVNLSLIGLIFIWVWPLFQEIFICARISHCNCHLFTFWWLAVPFACLFGKVFVYIEKLNCFSF